MREESSVFHGNYCLQFWKESSVEGNKRMKGSTMDECFVFGRRTRVESVLQGNRGRK